MADPCRASGGWSELPGDLLFCVLQLLELPEAVAVSAVCKSWASAATAAGVPHRRTPWLVSWDHWPETSTNLRFHSVLETSKTYEVSSPQGRSLAWFGASHGWLVAADELFNPMLYNPFTFATIPLPPVSDFDCVEAVYDSEGSIVEYLFGKSNSRCPTAKIGRWLKYDKVALSCAPSPGGDYTAMIIYYDAKHVSFARSGEGRWRSASTIPQDREDRYIDCVYHRGRFYTLTLRGVLEVWDLEPPCEPTKLVFYRKGDRKYKKVSLRFLVSTPWGDLLQLRFFRAYGRPVKIGAQIYSPRKFRVKIYKVDTVKNGMVRLTSSTAAFRDHAVFVGQNHSACLPTKNFPELRPNRVYFTTSWLVDLEDIGFGSEFTGGVGIYNLQSQMFEDAFPFFKHGRPDAVWFTPNI